MIFVERLSAGNNNSRNHTSNETLFEDIQLKLLEELNKIAIDEGIKKYPRD